jgi:hypothetical protein
MTPAVFKDRPSTAFLLTVVALVGLLVAHASVYLPFLADDALISLRYARRLLDGHGLTWTGGQPVEGYSNLLWILLTAGLGALGLDLITAARCLGVAATGLVIVHGLWWHLDRGGPRRALLPAVFGLSFFCLSAPVAVWAIGGLEQPLIAALLAVVLAACLRLVDSGPASRRRVIVASVALGLMCLTRPDAPVFAVAVTLAVLIARRTSGRGWDWPTTALLAAGSALCYAGQTAFRLWYYGELVPNTALVKIAFTASRLGDGARHVLSGLGALWPFAALAFGFMLLGLGPRETRHRALLLLAPCAAWLAYLVAIGGDVFPAYRHFVPVLVVFAFATVEGLQWTWDRVSGRATQRLVATVGCAGLLAIHAYTQATDPENRRATTERWEWDGKVVGLLLKQAFGARQPLLAVTAAGCLPYWSELPAIDMMGLNDHYLPRHPPPDFGTGLVGHDLGDGQYVLSRAPDIVAFHTGESLSAFRSGRELLANPEFHRRYAAVKLLGTYPHRYLATLFVRKHSEKIGIQTTATRIVVPAFLLNALPATYASLDDEGRLAVTVSRDSPAAIDMVPPGGDEWVVSADARPGDALRVLVARAPSATRITVEATGPQPVLVYALVLTRPAGAARSL